MSRLALAVLAASFFFACPQPAPMCNATTCPTGCCSAAGMCETGASSAACGRGGAACTSCVLGQVCSAGLCQLPVVGGGVATGGGTAMGGGAGGGTQCGPSNCMGCCLNNQCVAPPNNALGATCGRNGDTCANCATTGAICDATTFTCTGGTGGGSAGGAAGGSGGGVAGGTAGGSGGGTVACGPGTCGGCCDNSGACIFPGTNTACGLGGSFCTNCTATGQVCSAANQCVNATGGGAGGGTVVGGGTAGGAVVGGGAAGGTVVGGGAAGGAVVGGGAAGGTVVGGGAAGGTVVGGGAAGGTVVGGGAAGGTVFGGGTAGGTVFGGGTAGGTVFGGGTAGGTVFGGGTAGGTVVGGGSAGTDVTGGYVQLQRLADGGTLQTPLNLSAETYAVHTLQGQTYSTVTGTGTVNGTFSIPGVPAGPFVFQDGTFFLETTQRSLVIQGESFGRGNVTRATINPTTLNVNVSNLAAWDTTNDRLDLWIPNQGRGLFGYQRFFPTTPTAGATTAATAINYFLYSSQLQFGMVNAAQGDICYANQVRTVANSGATTTSIIRSAQAPAFSQMNGQTSTVAAALSPPPSFAQAITWDLNAFAALQAQLPAGMSPAGALSILTYPTAAVGLGFEVVNVNVPIGSPVPSLLTIAHPLVSSWQHSGVATFRVLGTRLAPGATTGAFFVGGVVRRATLASLAAGPISPVIGPVRNVQIDGQDVSQPRSGFGTNPVVSWQAPALGTPTRYVVTFARLELSMSDTTVAETTQYFTTNTSFRVPPGMLVLGQPYLLEVAAESGRGIGPGDLFLPPSSPSGQSWVVSAVVTP